MQNRSIRHSLTIATALAAALVVSGCGDDSPAKSDEDQIRDVVAAQEDAVRTGDAEAFLDTFCDEQRTNLARTVTNEMLAAKAMGGETKIVASDIKIDGDHATVTVDATIGGEKNGPSPEVYVKADGDWKNC